MPNNEFETIPHDLLVQANGGMRYGAGDRESTNVEDRRTPEGKAENQKWFDDNRGDYNRGGGLDPLPAPQPNDPSKDLLPGPRDES